MRGSGAGRSGPAAEASSGRRSKTPSSAPRATRGFSSTSRSTYGGARRLTRAARRLAEQGLKPDQIDEAASSGSCTRRECPTWTLTDRHQRRGCHFEYFLPWQTAYAEIIFNPALAGRTKRGRSTGRTSPLCRRKALEGVNAKRKRICLKWLIGRAREV